MQPAAAREVTRKGKEIASVSVMQIYKYLTTLTTKFPEDVVASGVSPHHTFVQFREILLASVRFQESYVMSECLLEYISPHISRIQSPIEVGLASH